MSKKQAPMEMTIRFFSFVSLVLYMIVAAMLTIIAIFSVYDSGLMILQVFSPELSFSASLINVINALLFTITIIVLFETVTAYFKTKHVEVRALLVAGLTAMVRHILVYNTSNMDAVILFASVALLAVLIAGIVLVKPESVGT